MKCPACKTTTLSMSERLGVEIDFCPDCRGVWLDRGELDKILEKSVAESAQTTVVQHNPFQNIDPNLHRDNYKYKRKKSFLEEIFD